MYPVYRAFIRWAFDRFYHEFSWTYDTVAWLVSRGLWQRWTLAALPYLTGRILELGCGTGYVQTALAASAPGCAVGVDESPSMLAQTRRRVERANRASGQATMVVLTRALAQSLPFQSESFDTVLATFPSDYIIHPATIAEIRRVLSPSGQFVLVDGAQFCTAGWYEWLVYLAYRLTFQSSVNDTPIHIPYQHVFAEAGFGLQQYEEQVGNSRVIIVVGNKSS